MVKTLRFWNGRSYGVLTCDEWKDAHIFIAAYSIADARRVCVEAGYSDPGYREIKEYWSECWGNRMAAVKPERGLWVIHGYDGEPERRLGRNPE